MIMNTTGFFSIMVMVSAAAALIAAAIFSRQLSDKQIITGKLAIEKVTKSNGTNVFGGDWISDLCEIVWE